MNRLFVLIIGSLFATFTLSACNSLFYYPRPEILAPTKEEKPLITATEVKSMDGTKLRVWIRSPEKKRRAVLLHFHGNAENLSTHFYFVNWLGQYGIELILFDYRGYGESEGEPSRSGLVEDGRAMIRFAVERAKENNVPLFILAQSLGGAVAIPAVAEEQPPIKALIVESSFPSYRRLARKKVGDFWLLWPLQWPLSFLVSTSWQPEDYIDKITSPVLIIHGNRDGVVPFENGQILFSMLKTKEKEFWEIPGGGHCPTLRTGSPFQQKFVSYLNSHLNDR